MEFKFSFSRSKSNVVKQEYNTTTLPKGFIPFTYSNNQVSREIMQTLYSKNVDVASIVNYVSQLCAELVITSKHMRGENEIKNSKVKELFLNPNEFDNAVNFWKNNFVSFFTCGNIFVNKIKPVGFKDYSKLYLLNGARVYPITNKSIDNFGTLEQNCDTRTIEITYYNELLDSLFLRYEVEEIIQIKDSALKSRILGDSRLYTAVKNANILNSLDETMQTVLGQSGALGFIKKTSRTNELAGIDPDEQKRIEDNFYSYGVGDGKKPIFFTNQDLNYVRILTAISEFLPIEISKLEFTKICLAIGGVPDVLFSSSETTFANLNTAQKILYTNVVIPTVNAVLNSYVNELELPNTDKLVVDYSTIECLQTDKKTEIEIEKLEQDLIIQQLEAEIITTQEAKKLLNDEEDNS